MILNEYGKIAYDMFQGLPKVFKNIAIYAFVIMPNHVHGIVIIDNPPNEPVGNATEQSSVKGNNSHAEKENLIPKSNAELHSLQDAGYKRTKMYLSKIIQAYKAEVTRRVKRISKDKIIGSVWQKSFYDRIIRTEKEFFNIQVYIHENQVRWQTDIENKLNKNPDKKYYENIFN